MRLKAFLIRDRGGRVMLLSPYDRNLVDDLKQIPYHAKTFNRDQKAWIVENGYADLLCEIVNEYFDAVWVVTEAEAEHRVNAAKASAQRQQHAPYTSHSTEQCLGVVGRVYQEEAALGVFPPANSEKLIRAAYRARATELHPDVAGPASHAAMVVLNRAYDTLLKRCTKARA